MRPSPPMHTAGIDVRENVLDAVEALPPRRPESRARRLLRAYRERGDREARRILIEEHLPLVRSLARRYAGRSGEFDDLVQVGTVGLIKAVDRFDLTRDVELTTYAIPTIVGELKRHLRDHAWSLYVPRRLKELSFRLGQLVDQLSGRLGRSPTVPELAEAAGAEEDEVVEALDLGHAYTALSLSSWSGESEELDPLEAIGADESGYEAMEGRQLILPGMDALDPRESRIIHLRFYADLTQSQIAELVGISQMHVSRLIRQALDKMRIEIERNGAA